VADVSVRVQAGDFDVGAELAQLGAAQAGVGAVASFVGVVRTAPGNDDVAAMTLEHYPGMTERAIEAIVAEAGQRWHLLGVTVIHRVGRLLPGECIVLAAVAAAHRGEAFAACEFIMDYLKTRAPFWKKEETPQGSRWVDAREDDETAAARWRSTAGSR
jgi:molybdopterin synthase catalytic subunit